MTSPTATAEIERFEKAVRALAELNGHHWYRDRPAIEGEYAASKAALLAALRAAEAERDEARAALAPFAAVAEHDIGTDETDADTFMPMQSHNRAPRLTVGDLRKARAALQSTSAKEG